MNGIVNFLKPPGMSSAQAAGALKRLTGEKTGHGGTLDPEAAGVLPLMVGRATRLFDYVAGNEKTYLAEIAFGAATDTQDAQGLVTETGTGLPDAAALRRVLPRFTGIVTQLPPQYSAIKKNGVPLYELARKGRTADVQPREVMITDISFVEEQPRGGFLLRIVCSKGTYIRTLCSDIGRSVGCPAHMRFLLRERTGIFCVEESVTLEELKAAAGSERGILPYLAPMDRLFAALPAIHVPDRLFRRCASGAPLAARDLPGVEQDGLRTRFRMYSGALFLGIGVLSGDRCVPEIVLFQEGDKP